MRTITTTRPTTRELNANELDQISGGGNGLSHTIIPYVPPQPPAHRSPRIAASFDRR